MTRLLTLALLGTTLSGCIIYDERLDHEAFDDDKDDDEEPWDDDETDEDPERPTRPDDDTDDTDDIHALLAIDPAVLVAGDTVIASIRSRGEPSLAEVVDVSVFGTAGVEVLAVQVRDETEVLVTWTAPARTLPGLQDVLLRFENGSATYLDDVLEVVYPEE